MSWTLAFLGAVGAWYFGGWLAAVAWLAGAVAWFQVAWFNTKRISARNAVYAALTYRGLPASEQGAVDSQAASICQRLGVNPDRLGPSHPVGQAAIGDSPTSSPAVAYALRSLAMHELGIPPKGTAVSRWYILRNPFDAAFASKQLDKLRREVERKYQVSLDEFD